MVDQETVTLQKRRGPPPTGKGTPVVVRMQPHQLAAIDAWAVENGALTRPDAVRRLVSKGLAKS